MSRMKPICCTLATLTNSRLSYEFDDVGGAFLRTSIVPVYKSVLIDMAKQVAAPYILLNPLRIFLERKRIPLKSLSWISILLFEGGEMWKCLYEKKRDQ